MVAMLIRLVQGSGTSDGGLRREYAQHIIATGVDKFTAELL